MRAPYQRLGLRRILAKKGGSLVLVTIFVFFSHSGASPGQHSLNPDSSQDKAQGESHA